MLTMGLVSGILGWLYKWKYIYVFGTITKFIRQIF
jgi:hypothetical protein